MSRLFVVALLALLSVGICDSTNLAAITWKHDINFRALLDDALKTSQAVVANVIMGYHKGSFVAEPVIDQVGTTSDFSLDEFITQTIEYHNKNAQNAKIIQLNFLTVKALRESIFVLLNKRKEIKFPIWLHADIVNGPGSDVWQDPVNGTQFIEEAKKMVNLVLSIGWKTYWSPDAKDVYTSKHTQAMEEIIKNTKINTADYKDVSINFPIRAVFALKRQPVLRSFYDDAKKTNPITYTIQSVAGDNVNPKELQAFIESYGIENVYMDVPDDLRTQINLSTNGASSLIQFELSNVIILITGYFFRNGFQ